MPSAETLGRCNVTVPVQPPRRGWQVGGVLFLQRRANKGFLGTLLLLPSGLGFPSQPTPLLSHTLCVCLLIFQLNLCAPCLCTAILQKSKELWLRVVTIWFVHKFKILPNQFTNTLDSQNQGKPIITTRQCSSILMFV